MKRWAPRSRAARRGLALAIGVLWLVAFEVAPWLHVALHDELAPHTHEIDGMIVTVSFAGGTHVHPDGSVHRDGEPDADVADGRAHAKAPAPLGHGAGSLAHHGVAVVAPPPVVTHPLAVRCVVTRVAVGEAFEPATRARGRASARAPPAVVRC